MNEILPKQQQNIQQDPNDEHQKEKDKKKRKKPHRDEPQQLIGPDPRKLRRMDYRDLLMQNLPSAEMYERSYMHRELINNIICTSKNEYILTFSIDGHIKFWKKVYHLIEFVKHFKAHNGLITGISLSKDHNLLATVSIDKTLKIFDIPNCDLMTVVRLTFSPYACEFIPRERKDGLLVAVSEDKSGRIMIVQPEEETGVRSSGVEAEAEVLGLGEGTANQNANQPANSTNTPDISIIETLSVHNHPVKFIKMNWAFGVCVSVDERAYIQLWDPFTFDSPQNKGLAFEFKLQTDYSQLISLNSIPLAFTLSPKGKYLAIMLKDRILRVFDFRTGKLVTSISENLKTISEIQQNPNDPNHELFLIDRNEFDRRVAIEKQIETSKEFLSMPSMQFDESEEFLIYPSLLGIKYYDIARKQVVKILGKTQTERFLKITVFQGKSLRNPTGSSTAKGEKRAADPTIYATAFKKTRFYIFSKKLPEETPDHQLIRDILNERPNKQQIQTINQLRPQDQPNQVILQTTMGDIHLSLFYKDCPKTCQNFIKLTKNCYYDGMIFHRVIKGFMIQSGCPKGDGTGGQSIWGDTFADEIVLPRLKHERAYMLSMANAGPNTNGSQFFITVIPCPWLDGKHTVFGRVSKGMEYVTDISKVKTDKNDKPLINVKIIKARVV